MRRVGVSYLEWMDDLLSREAHNGSLSSFTLQSLDILVVNANDVNRLQIEGFRVGNNTLSGIEQLSAGLSSRRT